LEKRSGTKKKLGKQEAIGDALGEARFFRCRLTFQKKARRGNPQREVKKGHMGGSHAFKNIGTNKCKKEERKNWGTGQFRLSKNKKIAIADPRLQK